MQISNKQTWRFDSRHLVKISRTLSELKITYGFCFLMFLLFIIRAEGPERCLDLLAQSLTARSYAAKCYSKNPVFFSQCVKILHTWPEPWLFSCIYWKNIPFPIFNLEMFYSMLLFLAPAVSFTYTHTDIYIQTHFLCVFELIVSVR